MRAVAFGALVLSVACSEQKAPPQDPNVIALISGEVLSRADFEKELMRELSGMEGAPERTPEQVEPFKKALVETIIERTLLLQAAKTLNVSVSNEEVDRRVMRMSSDFPAESFDEALSQGHTSVPELKERTRGLLTIEKLFQEHVYTRVALTEEELRRYYEEHAAEFREPEQVHAAQIVVKGLDEARRIQGYLRGGKKFADLARKYSLSPDAKVGGDLGFFAQGTMPPEFDAVLFKLSEGEVSDVVTTEYGFHLFKLLDKRAARKKDLSEVRAQVEERLLKSKRAQAEKEFVRGLKEKAQIRVNDQTLLSVTGRGHGGEKEAEKERSK
jgi:parvulin-like peptidyl-prolyl isomerase